MTVVRHEPLATSPRMSRVVVHEGVAWMCFTPADPVGGIAEQTKAVLARLDHYLGVAGALKANLLTAEIWVADMAAHRDAVTALWNDWVDPANPPVLALTEARLGRPQVLVEIKVSAAV